MGKVLGLPFRIRRFQWLIARLGTFERLLSTTTLMRPFEEFTIKDIACFFRWLVWESRGAIELSRSVETYWNNLGLLRRQETGQIYIDPVLRHQWKNVQAVSNAVEWKMLVG